MNCAWKELLCILPSWMCPEVDRQGREHLTELRMRLGLQPQLILGRERGYLSRTVSETDLQFCFNTASRYSPWAAASAAYGYLSVPGGHRVGICGDAVIKEGRVDTLRRIRSLCIRVARDFPGIGKGIPTEGSLLILGAPGWGKTTLLRDLIRIRSEQGIQTGVVDERGELFPDQSFPAGKSTDILSGCGKAAGIHMLLRTMGPMCIAVDEITQPEDCTALQQAVGCGVTVLATAHAANREDLYRREVYRNLIECGIFDAIVILRPDKSWHMERV